MLKSKSRFFIALAGLLLLAPAVIGAAGEGNDTGKAPLVVGGQCAYDEYRGTCRICSILKTNESAKQEQVIGGTGYAGFEVKYEFVPAELLPANVSQWVNESVISCNNLFQLCNSWYPGPKFLKKYNITEGSVFDCNLSVITSGTCTPMIIEFKDIDRCDYFESQAGVEKSSGQNNSG
jgi:hypothetical protein